MDIKNRRVWVSKCISIDEGQTDKEHGCREHEIYRIKITLERHEHIYKEKRSWVVHMWPGNKLMEHEQVICI